MTAFYATRNQERSATQPDRTGMDRLEAALDLQHARIDPKKERKREGTLFSKMTRALFLATPQNKRKPSETETVDQFMCRKGYT